MLYQHQIHINAVRNGADVVIQYSVMGGELMELDFIRNRITELRIRKGVSEYKMSQDLGHSRNYIQGITSGRSLPSVQELLYICDYLGIEPAAFFDEQKDERILVQKALEGMRDLPDKDLLTLISLIDRLKESVQ